MWYVNRRASTDACLEICPYNVILVTKYIDLASYNDIGKKECLNSPWYAVGTYIFTWCTDLLRMLTSVMDMFIKMDY